MQKPILALISGLVLALCFPKFNLSFLVWVSLVPLLIAIQNISSKRAFFVGVISGTVFYSCLLYWLIPTLTAVGEHWLLGVISLLLLSLYLSMYFGFFCVGFNFFTTCYSILATCFLSSALWVALEFIRSFLFTGFPWGILGYTQWNFLSIIQIADITGVYGVSFLIVFVNITIFHLLTIQNATLKIKNCIITIVILAIYLAYGLFHQSPNHQITKSPELKVAILQGNVDQYKKWDERYVEEIINTYTELVQQVKVHKPDLIVWPETAIPGYLFHEKQLYDWVMNLIKETNCYHLVGTADYDTCNRLYNTAVLFSPERKLVGQYKKIHLVPFGETIPLRSILGKFIKVVNELGDFSSGNDFTVFTITPSNNPTIVPFSVNICFESIFPYISRKFTNYGAKFLVNITNDAWFLKTSAPYQHFIFSVFRAIENRRQVVRSGNTGISGLIDSSGRIFSQTEIFKKTFRVFLVEPKSKKTLYTKFGDLFAITCLIATVVNIIFCLLKKKSVATQLT